MKKLTTRLSALALSAALSVTAVGCAFASNSAYTHPFTDVPDTSWYASYVDYAYAHHLFAGTSATTFTPGRSITRGEVVTALASMHERLTGESTQLQEPPPFSDVPDGAFYAMPVTWAAKRGIVAGCGDGTFQPNRAITREELACMLQSYLTATKASLDQTVTPTAYTDTASISAWASDAVTKLSAHGVFTGDEQKRFLPQGVTTRAEAATVLTNLYQDLRYHPAQDVNYQYIRYDCDENTDFTSMLGDLDEKGETGYKILTSYADYAALVQKVQANEENVIGVLVPNTFQMADESLFDDHVMLAIEVQYSGTPLFYTELCSYVEQWSTGDPAKVDLHVTIFCDDDYQVSSHTSAAGTTGATSDVPGYVYFIPVSKTTAAQLGNVLIETDYQVHGSRTGITN